jgi:hypothetical protein
MMIHRLIVFVCWRGRWRVGQIDCPSAHQHVKITDAPRGEGKSAGEAETRGKGEESESSRKVSLRLSERIHDRGCAKSRGCDAGVNLGGQATYSRQQIQDFSVMLVGSMQRGHGGQRLCRHSGGTESGQSVAVGTRGLVVICFLFLVSMDGDGQVSSRSRCC